MINDVKKVLVTKEEIDNITKRLGKQISIDFKDKNPLFIGLLKGAIPFMTDLLKNVDIMCTLDYMKVSSYDGTASTGNVVIKGEMPKIEGRHVIIIDDILETGRTLKAVRELLLSIGAKSVSICVLLDKPEGRVVDMNADYVGQIVPHEFVIGYGLDYNENYRNLPFVGVLKEEVYTK